MFGSKQSVEPYMINNDDEITLEVNTGTKEVYWFKNSKIVMLGD